ncbi:tRNA threonylcarbamoyladenosine biosynthesis protein TsaB [Helicobacter sp. 13S00477-4]|uniref:tRNA threonylcarbamoyladenosine biosynthesis protein TsaB n=1 Tax=Helicobacter sp. 13S00477-4 TaxID=1905759 RepID=UPI000BC965E5|nr:tRNA threonylcarbamoyladenosine biosynthesis protein TsaB [Helicobacter sp. 13S00477-4]PAF51659.1 hypothetical protein BKH44_05070 [Helicobacter sp. 13S00477-4]
MDKKVDLVLLSIHTPIKVGIYKDKKLQKSFLSSKKTGDGLIELFSEIFSYLEGFDLQIESIFYARGPGSFTALKLTHIFLHTLVLSKGVKLYSTDSFYFNQNMPIKAFGNKFFVCTEHRDNIELKDIGMEEIEDCFILPEEICPEAFDTQNTPLYILPPV